MSKIQERITSAMDKIQKLMESNPRAHLEPDTKIHELMSIAGIYFSNMNDEDRDYYQFVQMAIEEKMEWNLP